MITSTYYTPLRETTDKNLSPGPDFLMLKYDDDMYIHIYKTQYKITVGGTNGHLFVFASHVNLEVAITLVKNNL